ncbi:MAG: yehU 6 [Mucilaginibacter sp.]|jgi:two-component system LytT family sensor kinase|nr:yehU 6 [Mucilaginibacter sp.]
MSKPKSNIIKIHILCWAIFILYEVLVSYSLSGKLSSFWDYAVHYILNIALFYCNTFLVFDKCLNEKRRSYSLLIVLILVELVVYTGTKYLVYLAFVDIHIYSPNQTFQPVLFITQSVWRAVYFMGLSAAYWSALEILMDRKKISELEKLKLVSAVEKQSLEKDLLEAENAYLKAQINPHLLFNVFGLIHHEVLKSSETAAETIVLLSDMMRYALTPPQKDNMVEIEAEIEHINNYILINQYRFNHKLNIKFIHENCCSAFRITPLLLVTMVENIFKYGELIHNKKPAIIELTTTGNRLNFSVNNEKGNRTHATGMGIGMSNVLKRLNQYYKNRFELDIENTEYDYSLNLSISN